MTRRLSPGWGWLALACLLAPLALGQDWNTVEIPYPGFRPHDLAVVGEAWWLVGATPKSEHPTGPEDYAPTVLHSPDGGQSWQKQDPGLAEGNLSAVLFPSERVGYVAGQDFSDGSPLILYTADGGRSWARARVPRAFGNLRGLFFLDERTGWAVGVDLGHGTPLLLYTTDGRSWARRELPGTEGGLLAVCFPSREVGYAVGYKESGSPLVLKTTDGGNTWQELPLPVAEGWLSALVFVDERTGWAAGGDGEAGLILSTGDGGESWQVTRLHGSFVDLNTVALVNRVVYAAGKLVDQAGMSGVIYRRGAEGWEKVYQRENSPVKALLGAADRLLAAVFDYTRRVSQLLWKAVPAEAGQPSGEVPQVPTPIAGEAAH